MKTILYISITYMYILHLYFTVLMKTTKIQVN